MRAQSGSTTQQRWDGDGEEDFVVNGLAPMCSRRGELEVLLRGNSVVVLVLFYLSPLARPSASCVAFCCAIAMRSRGGAEAAIVWVCSVHVEWQTLGAGCFCFLSAEREEDPEECMSSPQPTDNNTHTHLNKVRKREGRGEARGARLQSD